MMRHDDETFAISRAVAYAPERAGFDSAVEAWSTLATDRDARFDRRGKHGSDKDRADRCPGGTKPEGRAADRASVPIGAAPDASPRQIWLEELDYMGIAPGRRRTEDRGRSGVHRLLYQFPYRGPEGRGSCRLEGRTARVQGIWVAGCRDQAG